MTEHDSTANEHGHDDHHGGSLKTYLMVFVALCVLTTASFMTYASWWPFSDHVSWAFMMAVSCTKAMLVILFFMHLLYEASWKYVLTIPAAFMSVFLVLMLVPDVGMRMNRASVERVHFMAAPEVEVVEVVEDDDAADHEHEKGGSH